MDWGDIMSTNGIRNFFAGIGQFIGMAAMAIFTVGLGLWLLVTLPIAAVIANGNAKRGSVAAMGAVLSFTTVPVFAGLGALIAFAISASVLLGGAIGAGAGLVVAYYWASTSFR